MHGCVNVFGSNTSGFMKPTAIQIKLITFCNITLMRCIVSIEQEKIYIFAPYSTEITVHLS